MKFKENQKYLCILSKSPGYKEGVVYTTYKNSDGKVCFMGSDGFEDDTTKLRSGFTEFVAKKPNPKQLEIRSIK